MARLVDYEALILDLRGALQARASWGRGQVLGLIDDLEQEHRIDQSAEAAFLRRFGNHFTETFLGLVPRSSATPDPLSGADLRTASEMDAGAATDHPTEGPACPPFPHRPQPDRTTPPDCRPAVSPSPTRTAAPATS